MPAGGYYREAINSDSERYGGSNVGNMGGLHAEEQQSHGQRHSLSLKIPPLATLILVREA